MSAEPSDLERFPTLSSAGRAMLQRLTEHPHAPIFRNRSGNRLLAEEVQALALFEGEVLGATLDWPASGLPEWLHGFVASIFAEVPYYRGLTAPTRFEDIPAVDRAILAADIARFVPDPQPLDRLINFRTTGTTGHPLLVPSHPVVAGSYLAFHKRALRRFGISPTASPETVGVILLGYQRKCFTYVSVSPTQAESGLAKINLHPDDWRDPGDRSRYLEAMSPELIAGDPISFAALLELPVVLKPRALMSVSMALSPALSARLSERFQCPVLDIYSMNEAGPIACLVPELGGHLLLQNRLYVEILDRHGQAVAEGVRGEITLTGGFNFCLPLLRYRTGDYGALSFTDEGPVIIGLSGRQPVRFRSATGGFVNNIDITHALAQMPLSRFTCHQCADGSVVLALPASESGWAGEAAAKVSAVLAGASVRIETLSREDKILQYTSELPEASTA
jgi:phenylacetate-CoA ligase